MRPAAAYLYDSRAGVSRRRPDGPGGAPWRAVTACHSLALQTKAVHLRLEVDGEDPSFGNRQSAEVYPARDVFPAVVQLLSRVRVESVEHSGLRVLHSRRLTA